MQPPPYLQPRAFSSPNCWINTGAWCSRSPTPTPALRIAKTWRRKSLHNFGARFPTTIRPGHFPPGCIGSPSTWGYRICAFTLRGSDRRCHLKSSCMMPPIRPTNRTRTMRPASWPNSLPSSTRSIARSCSCTWTNAVIARSPTFSASAKPTCPPRSIDSRNAYGALEKPMELDDLRQQWQAMDRKLDRSIALNLRLLTEKRTRWTKLRLVPMLLLQPVQIVIGLALTIFFARFWIANLGTWSLVISGVFLHVLSIGLIIDAVVRTLLIVRINYAAPVVTIQRYLALMRRWEIRSFKWGWVAIWLALPALLMVGAKLSTTLNLWSVAPNAVIYTAIGGLVGVGLSYLFDLFARRSPRLGAAMDNMYVGYS